MIIFVQLVEFVITHQHWEQFVIWWLEFLAHCIPMHKNISTGLHIRTYVQGRTCDNGVVAQLFISTFNLDA